MNQSVSRVRRGDLVKILWKDACEGPIEQNLALQRPVRLRGSITCPITSVGRFFRVSNGYLVLADVLYEESNGQVLFEKQGEGKWLSIPLSVVTLITPVREMADCFSKEAKRRRTVFKQLRFIPRAKRLESGQVSRMLYVV